MMVPHDAWPGHISEHAPLPATSSDAHTGMRTGPGRLVTGTDAGVKRARVVPDLYGAGP